MDEMGNFIAKTPNQPGSLVSDALPTKAKTKQSLIDLDNVILQNIEQDLQPYEKLTLLFLILDNYFIFSKVYQAFYKNESSSFFLQFIGDIKNWKTKFLEALCITKCVKHIRNLGLDYEELKIIYDPTTMHTNPEILKTPKVHFGAKLLWHLFENVLDERQSKALLEKIYLDIEPPSGISEDDPMEMHAFYWMEKGYINLDENGYGDLEKILKCLKPLGISPSHLFYYDLEKYCKNSEGKIPGKIPAIYPQLQANNELDAEIKITQKRAQYHASNGPLHKKSANSYNNFALTEKPINSALVIILNVVTVPGSEFDDRRGSEADVRRLKKTFKGLNFHVEVHNEPTHLKIHQIFENLRNTFDRNKYDGLFVCILSHGIKDHFISHDNREIPLKTIENYVCSYRLQYLPKIILVQACQGEKTGVPMVSRLVLDGPISLRPDVPVRNTIDYAEFLIFWSTMQECKAIRDEIEGSWFIEAVCDVLQRNTINESRLFVVDWVATVTKIVSAKRGYLGNGLRASQLPDHSSRLTERFFFPSYRDM